MGDIAKLLSLKDLAPRTITSRGVWADVCENIHLHYKDLRLEFSQKEWAEVRAAINHLGLAVEKILADHPDYEEGDPTFLVQAMFNTMLQSASDYYPNRLSIELERDDTVHLHYRNIRLHLTEPDFVTMAEAFAQALRRLNHYREPKRLPFEGVKKPTAMSVPIDLVQPYDAGHKPGFMDAEHAEGVKYCQRGIKAGLIPRPILVDCRGQRKDGFKRYMAHLALGFPAIDVIVDPNAMLGGQNNQSMFLEEGESHGKS